VDAYCMLPVHSFMNVMDMEAPICAGSPACCWQHCLVQHMHCIFCCCCCCVTDQQRSAVQALPAAWQVPAGALSSGSAPGSCTGGRSWTGHSTAQHSLSTSCAHSCWAFHCHATWTHNEAVQHHTTRHCKHIPGTHWRSLTSPQTP
jgi:hypothetical protein